MRKRIFTVALAFLATMVIACGSSGAGASSPVGAGSTRGGGSAYLTADDQFGVNGTMADIDGAAGSLSDAVQGAGLQP